MKIRTDFVTNSSSSSYIVAFKGFDELKDLNFNQLPVLAKSALKLFEEFFVDGNEVLKTREDVDKKVLDFICCDTIEEAMTEYEEDVERFKQWYEVIDKGFIIVEVEVDYSDERTGPIIRGLHDGENIILLERW
jgi:hypothetical protein